MAHCHNVWTMSNDIDTSIFIKVRPVWELAQKLGTVRDFAGMNVCQVVKNNHQVWVDATSEYGTRDDEYTVRVIIMLAPNIYSEGCRKTFTKKTGGFEDMISFIRQLNIATIAQSIIDSCIEEANNG